MEQKQIDRYFGRHLKFIYRDRRLLYFERNFSEIGIRNDKKMKYIFMFLQSI